MSFTGAQKLSLWTAGTEYRFPAQTLGARMNTTINPVEHYQVYSAHKDIRYMRGRLSWEIGFVSQLFECLHVYVLLRTRRSI